MIPSRAPSSRTGFTLVELLVAIAVLSIIVVAASQILGTATTLTTTNNKHMDADDQARMVFDRMTIDFARMVKRKDVDSVFWNAAGNDVMFFYTEGASYFDSSTFNNFTGVTGASATNPSPEKNSISLVGYRINNLATSSNYNQLERLAKALSWDGGAYNSTASTNNSVQPNAVVFLTYPPAGADSWNGLASPFVVAADPTGAVYSAAYYNSTLLGAFGNGKSTTTNTLSALGSIRKFNNSTDTAYRSIGSQVFRMEYSFQLKDGTLSSIPMMLASTATNPNGVPSSSSASGRPVTAAFIPLDSTQSLATAGTSGSKLVAVGSRYYDTKNKIGYICIDATPKYAIWHEIGIQDIAAIIVTIAVIDRQGLAFLNSVGGDLSLLAAAFPDYSSATSTPTAANASLTGDPSYLVNPNDPSGTGWAYALLPGNAVSTTAINSGGTMYLPQPMANQIRVYQRYFYLNNF